MAGARSIVSGRKDVPKLTTLHQHSVRLESVNNPQANAETERFMRTLKIELIWLEEFTCLDEVQEKLSASIDFYNNHYLHSDLGYWSPQEYERLY